MQKSIAFALVIGALIVGGALVYHGRQLLHLSAQLQATQKQTATLDTNLQAFASQLPALIGEAGRNAGRQAVHGLAEEAVQMPLNWLKSTPLKGATAGLRRVLPPADPGTGTISRDGPPKPTPLRNLNDELRPGLSPADPGEGPTNQALPLIRFDIPQPVVINIGILADLKELPAWLLPPRGTRNKPATTTNQAEGQAEEPTPHPHPR